MNENFVRIIFTEEQDKNFIRLFAGAMASTINEHLMESDEGIVFEHYETNEGHYVYEVATTKDLDDATAEEMANTIASSIPGEFDIEVSGDIDPSRSI